MSKKHFYKKSINDWEFQIQFVEEPNPYVKLKTHIGETVISTVITTNSPDVGKENEILFTTSYSINRYTGAFTLINHDYRTKSLGFKKYGKCKKNTSSTTIGIITKKTKANPISESRKHMIWHHQKT